MVLKKIINYGSHHIDNFDLKNFKKVMNSNFLTQGPFVEKFENKLNNYFKSKYSVVLSNGTAALHLAIKALRLKENSTILTTPLTFISTASSIIMNNHKPLFVDIEKDTLTLDLNKVEDELKKNSKIRAIIGVDFGGHPCNWKDLYFLKKKI